jgi:hypothetical protein
MARRLQDSCMGNKNIERISKMKTFNYVSMTVTHNEHKLYYQTAEQFIAEGHVKSQFLNQEEVDKAIETDEIWSVQWYPNTPVGSCMVYASKLNVIFEYIQSS